MRRLLIVPMFAWALFSVSCQKKESGSVENPDAKADTIDTSVEDPTPAFRPNPLSITLPFDSVLPQASTPSSDDGRRPDSGQPPSAGAVNGLSIVSSGIFVVGHETTLRAMAQYGSGSQKEVPARWTLLSNEAAASLGEDGGIVAMKSGRVVVRAHFNGKEADAVLTFAEPMLRHREDQFWVYRLNGELLSFNSPWDKAAGHGIIRLPGKVPEYGLQCLQEARTRFYALQSREQIQGRIRRLLGVGATSQLIFLVNVVPVDGRREELRRLDRDAYFWHWNRESERPSLSMSRFKEGSWVWELIASPGECLQPDEKEMQRYLDYAAARLAAVQ